MTILILFPKEVENIQSYAKSFLTTAEYMVGVNQFQKIVPDFKHKEQFIEEMVAKNTLAMPEILTLEQSPNENVREKLNLSIKKLKKYWLRALPPLINEVIQRETVGILQNSFSGCDTGSLLYRRDTNQGSLIVLHRHVRVFSQTGEIQHIPMNLESSVIEVEPPASFIVSSSNESFLLASPIDGQTVVDAALTLATIVGFGIGGPIGIAIAGLAATVEVIFNKLMSSSHDGFITSIDTVLRNEIQQEELFNYAASFNAYTAWFGDYYDQAWSGELKLPIPSDLQTASNEAFLQFFNVLKESVDDPNKPLLQNIEKLMIDHNDSEVTFRVKALRIFLCGAGLHLNLLKTRILLDALPKYNLDSPYLPILIKKLERYIKHANETVQYIDNQIQSRLNQVSEVKSGSVTVGFREVYSTHSGLLFEDNGDDADVSKFENFMSGLPSKTVDFISDDPGSCCSPSTQHPDQANQKRTEYINNLTKKLQEKYFYTEKDKIAKTIQEWQKALDVYKPSEQKMLEQK